MQKVKHMYELTENEIAMCKSLADDYRDLYQQLHNDIESEKLSWEFAKNGFYYNLTPFAVEISGFKQGTLLKKEPEKKDNVFGYGKKGSDIRIIRAYAGQHISQETFVIMEKSRKIIIRYSDSLELKTLDKIGILNFNSDKEIDYVSFNFDRRNSSFTKETYDRQNENITTIFERGFIERRTGKILIDRNFEIRYTELNEVKEILVQENNLANGQVRTSKIFG